MHRLVRGAATPIALLVVLGASALVSHSQDAEPLPRLGADLAQTSVSGLSSGAYMAAQVQMAHGTIVAGAGLVAGGPYGCVESIDNPLIHVPGIKAAQAVEVCMRGRYRAWGLPDARSLARRARGYAADGKIDPVSSVSGDKVYLFTGAKDDKVATSIVETAAAFYRAIGVPAAQILFRKDEIDASHAFVTETFGADCGTDGPNFFNDCDYDQAREILEHIYGALNDPSETDGRFLVFDQTAFATDPAVHGLAGGGLVYIPSACRESPDCRAHVVFHGCLQSREFIGDIFARRSGFARWAATNRIILLFPQTAKSKANPYGCWDWWGHTGRAYHTKEAPQITAVRHMIDRLSGTPD